MRMLHLITPRRTPSRSRLVNTMLAWLLPHLVAKRDHPARVRLHLHEVQSNILVEPGEERDPFPDQDGHDRIAHFVSESEPKAFTRDGAPSDEPDAPEGRLQ